MFHEMCDDALCIDRDREFALMTPDMGDGSTLESALSFERDIYDADPTGGTVSVYA